MTKTLIVDCDGTILNWRDTYVEWLRSFGMLNEDDATQYYFKDHIHLPGDPDNKPRNPAFADVLSEIFNQTFLMTKLPPIEGAVDALNKFHKEGYAIKAVSSFTNQYEAMKLREKNLINVFGDIFQDFTALPLHSSKFDYLSKQDKNAIFVEDSPIQLTAAMDAGFSRGACFLIPADWNFQPNKDLRIPFLRIGWKRIVDNVLQ